MKKREEWKLVQRAALREKVVATLATLDDVAVVNTQITDDEFMVDVKDQRSGMAFSFRSWTREGLVTQVECFAAEYGAARASWGGSDRG